MASRLQNNSLNPPLNHERFLKSDVSKSPNEIRMDMSRQKQIDTNQKLIPYLPTQAVQHGNQFMHQ